MHTVKLPLDFQYRLQSGIARIFKTKFKTLFKTHTHYIDQSTYILVGLKVEIIKTTFSYPQNANNNLNP